MVVSSCSLLFSASDLAGRDGGMSLDGAAPDAETGELAPVSDLGIGQDRAFRNYTAWHTARVGDLTNRQLLRVEVTGSLASMDLLGGSSSGCQGTVHANSTTNPVRGNILTIDLDGLTPCEIGDMLTGPNGSVIVVAASTVGVREVATFYDSEVTGPILLDHFQTNSEAYVTLRADPEQPHQGIQGAGIKIGNGNSLSTALHNVVIEAEHTHLVGFEITWASAAAAGPRRSVVDIRAPGVLLDRLLIHGDYNPMSDGIHIGPSSPGATTAVVRNSFIFHVGRAGIHMQDVTGGQLEVLSCSFANCMQADNIATPEQFACVSVAGGSLGALKLVNTIAVANAGIGIPEFIVDNNNSFLESSHNAAPQASPPFGTDTTSAAMSDFLTFPTNLHLGNTQVENQGIPLDFTHDIDGDLRTESWPIGADQP